MSFRILITLFLLIFTSQARAEDAPIPMPEISEDMLKQSKEILNSVQKIQASPEYKNHQNWINQNKQQFFARQAEKLPTVDYGITKEQLEKDTIAKLLNNYRFKSEDFITL